MTNLKPAIIIICITGIIFLLTHNPLTSPFKLQMALVCLVVFLLYYYINTKKEASLINHQIIYYLMTATIIFLVASTGWFFSPFFFSLYLLAIMLAFVFPPPAFLGFIAILVSIFSVNIGEVDITYDFLIVLSLLTTIPLSFYLRKEYLRLKESSKEILVLEKDRKKSENKVEEILANVVNNFAVNLRQPLNMAKQWAYQLEEAKSKQQKAKDRERIIVSVEESLRMLKKFEEDVTGKKLLSNDSASNNASADSVKEWHKL